MNQVARRVVDGPAAPPPVVAPVARLGESNQRRGECGLDGDDPADPARVDDLLDPDMLRIVPPLECFHEHDAVPAGCVDHGFAFGGVAGDGFLAQDGPDVSRVRRGDADRGMGGAPGGDDGDIEPFFRQHLVQVCVSVGHLESVAEGVQGLFGKVAGRGQLDLGVTHAGDGMVQCDGPGADDSCSQGHGQVRTHSIGKRPLPIAAPVPLLHRGRILAPARMQASLRRHPGGGKRK